MEHVCTTLLIFVIDKPLFKKVNLLIIFKCIYLNDLLVNLLKFK